MNISKDENNLNFQNVALGLILPFGEILYINKIEGFNNHIDYLIELYVHETFVHSVLEDLDLDYYKENPNKVPLEIFPLFQKEGCFIFTNLSPNTCMPTTWGIFYLSDSITLEQKALMERIRDKFKEIVFFDIAKFDSDTCINTSYFENMEIGTPNDEKLYEALEFLDEKKGLKK